MAKKKFPQTKTICHSDSSYRRNLKKRCSGGSSCSGRANEDVEENNVVDALMFQAEVRRIEKLLYRVAWSYMGNNADVEDAVQDALIRAWEKRDTLRDLKQFRPWMARILTNRCRDMLRKRKKFSFIPLEDAAAQEVEPPEPDSPVLEAVGKLKPELRTLVTLHYVDGYSIQEMAEDLGIPENTVKTRMRSARRQLGRTILLERGAE